MTRTCEDCGRVYDDAECWTGREGNAVSPDHQSNQGLIFATLIGLSGVIVAAALAVALFAFRLLAAMETELDQLKAVVDGVGGLP